MPILNGFLWLVGFLLLGEALVWWLSIPVSPGVVGLLALTLWAMLRGRIDPDIQAASQPLIQVLAMLIMPGVVGIFFIRDAFSGQWLAVAVALTLGTLLSVGTTFFLMRLFMPLASADDHEDE
jgi:putative effector of murein hydrolase LrgA (UPF0299 family)